MCGCVVNGEFDLVGVARWVEGGIERIYDSNCCTVVDAHDHELSRIVERKLAWEVETCLLAQSINRLAFKWHQVVCRDAPPASQCYHMFSRVVRLDQANAMIVSICNYDAIVSVHKNVHGEKKSCTLEIAITKQKCVRVCACDSRCVYTGLAHKSYGIIVTISNKHIIVMVDHKANRTV